MADRAFYVKKAVLGLADEKDPYQRRLRLENLAAAWADPFCRSRGGPERKNARWWDEYALFLLEAKTLASIVTGALAHG